MNQILNFLQFLDLNKKIYFNMNTGKGKTLIASIMALLFLELHDDFHIFSNFHLNIWNKKTKKSMCSFTPYGILPYSTLDKGKFLIILDDFINLRHWLQNFTSIIAVLCRKELIYTYITLHFYTHLTKENREIFNLEALPEITNLKFNPNTHNLELSNDSVLKVVFFDSNTLEFKHKKSFFNILRLIKNEFNFKNVYINPNKLNGLLYNTNEIVNKPNERLILNEVEKWSKNLKDIEQNIDAITKNKKLYKQYVKEIRERKNI